MMALGWRLRRWRWAIGERGVAVAGGDEKGRGVRYAGILLAFAIAVRGSPLASATRKGPVVSSRFFKLQVDHEALIDEMHAFVTDPQPSRNERPVIVELGDLHPESVDVLESMLLDGTEERQDVAAYVAAVFAAPEPARG
jgi:hypothetical protein